METKIKDVDITINDFTMKICNGKMRLRTPYNPYESLTEMLFDLQWQDGHLLEAFAEELDNAGVNWKSISRHCREEIKEGIPLNNIIGSLFNATDEGYNGEYCDQKESCLADPDEWIGPQNFKKASKQIMKEAWEMAHRYLDISMDAFINEREKSISDSLLKYFTFKDSDDCIDSIGQIYDSTFYGEYLSFVDRSHRSEIRSAIKDMCKPYKEQSND